MSMRALLLAASACLLLSACHDRTPATEADDAKTATTPADTAPATDTRTAADTTPAPVAAADMDFYRKALTSGRSEVELSRYAATNASRAEVRELAQMLVEEHTALNAKLETASGLAPAATMPDAADAAAAAAVRERKGGEFDRAFLDHLAKGHAKSIALYEATSTSASDAATRALASEALPHLREHAQRIGQLQR